MTMTNINTNTNTIYRNDGGKKSGDEESWDPKMKDSGKHKIRYLDKRQKTKRQTIVKRKVGQGKLESKSKSKDTHEHNIPQQWWKEKQGRGKLGSKDKDKDNDKDKHKENANTKQYTATMVERKAGTRKVGIQRQALSSS